MSEFREATAAVEALETHVTLLREPRRWEHEDAEDALRAVLGEVNGATNALLDKFRARCTMLDPITREPRFGPKMLARVQDLLQRYDAVKAAVDGTSDLVAQVEQHASQRRQRELEHQQRAEQERLRELEAEAQRQRALEEERARAEAEEHVRVAQAEEQERQRIAALAALAQQKREERHRARDEEARRAQEEQERHARAAAEFPVGRVGLERAIAMLRESTGSAAALRLALQQLHAVASNVCAAPENAALRRIPKLNAHFERDVGQFRGGHECLLALGFRETEDPDGSVVFMLEEPDLSVDLDAWSGWFDTLKSSTEFLASVLQQS